jgi:hypothetical protein
MMGGNMILGLSGQKGSGKEAVAAYLIKEHQFERKAFADPIKESVAALLGIPFHEIDKYKNDDEIVVSVGRSDDFLSRMTFSDFLENFATKAHRVKFGEGFWLDYTLPKDGYYSGRKIVVTDVKYENEVRRIHNCLGFVVQVIKPGFFIKEPHREGSARTVDYVLKWTSDLDEEIEKMLVRLGSADMRVKAVLGS